MILELLQTTWTTISAHTLFFVELLLAIIIFISLFFFRKQKPIPQPTIVKPLQSMDHKAKSSIVITSQDIRAIAGDDVLTTQLDLARAYIEIGKKKLAKKILEHVIQHGNVNQKHMAQSLMTAL